MERHGERLISGRILMTKANMAAALMNNQITDPFKTANRLTSRNSCEPTHTLNANKVQTHITGQLSFNIGRRIFKAKHDRFPNVIQSCINGVPLTVAAIKYRTMYPVTARNIFPDDYRILDALVLNRMFERRFSFHTPITYHKRLVTDNNCSSPRPTRTNPEAAAPPVSSTFRRGGGVEKPEEGENGIMRQLLAALALVVATSAFAGCTAQERARSLGGTAQVNLPTGRKLVTVTWKENDIWYMTRLMRSDEQPETYEFSESSSLGIMEGRVVIREHR